MAASAWQIYREFKESLALAKVNLSSDSIKCALLLSTSNCGDVGLATAHYATLTNQVAGLFGYATGGVVVAATWTKVDGTCTFDVADPTWVASGGDIVARFAVLYDNTSTDKDLIAYCLLDATPANIVCEDGNPLTLQIGASGVFTLSGGEV